MALSTEAKKRLVIAVTDAGVGAEIAGAINDGNGISMGDLAATANAKGASLVGIEDAATIYTAVNVETALAEVMVKANATNTNLASTANAKGASLVGIEDAAALITAATVEAALAELVKYECVALADPGGANAAIPVTRSASIAIVTAGAETNTLAIPTFLGQKLFLFMDTRVGGDRVVTVAQAVNQAGNTVMTFGAVRDSILLQAATVGGALRWQVIANDGVALA